jgi:hypothetical protein
MGGVRSELPDLTITIAGAAQRSSSTIDTVGGYVVLVATAVPRLAVTLTSVYLGQIDGDTGATHLRLVPERRAELLYRVVPAAPLSPASAAGRQPGTAHARSCVLDHAAELQQLLAELADDVVAIDVGSAALERAVGMWLDAPRLEGPQ